MSKRRTELGQMGEDLACRELARLGYEIVARRYRRRCGEIDVIARDGKTLAFIEVKCRGTAAFGAPSEAVTGLKQRRMARVAEAFIVQHRLSGRPCRFDVVSVVFGGRSPTVTIIRDAFAAVE
jgi:putative endonuclease